MKTYIVNLIGGPGVGKSTIAAGIFYELKRRGIPTEIVYEYTKEKVWEEAYHTLDDEIYLFAKQLHKLWRLNNKVKFVITDHPLFNSAIYDNGKSGEHFNDFVYEQFSKFTNLNCYINRSVEYETEGRVQNAEEAKDYDNRIKEYMDANDIHYVSYDVETAVDFITTFLVAVLQNEEHTEPEAQSKYKYHSIKTDTITHRGLRIKTDNTN